MAVDRGTGDHARAPSRRALAKSDEEFSVCDDRAPEELESKAVEVADWADLLANDASRITVELHDANDFVVVVAANGQVTARPHGGPIRIRGGLRNTRRERLPVWHATEQALHRSAAEALVDAALPHPLLEGKGPPFTPPGERASELTALHEDGRKATLTLWDWKESYLLGVKELHRRLREVHAQLQRSTPSGEMDNPELAHWPEG